MIQAWQMSELLLAILLRLDPMQPIVDQIAVDEVVVAFVRKGEGCIGLARRLGHRIGPKGCEAAAKRFNRPTIGYFAPNSAGPVNIGMVLYPGEAWALRREKGRVVYFGPLAEMNKRR